MSNSTSSGSPDDQGTQEETAQAVAPDSAAGVDTALQSEWMWVMALTVIIVLAAIIAVLLVTWQRPPNGEYQ